MSPANFAPAKADILVVDDSQVNRRLLQKILSRAGYQARSASSGAEALAAVAEALPDMILLDINMHEMSGFEVCQRLKEDKATQDIPIIFISGIQGVEEKVQAFEIGGLDYITKPFQIPEVLARIETHLSLRRLQLELQHKNAELEDRNAELDAYAGMVAHDLRSPLTSLMMRSQMLERYYDPQLDEKGIQIAHDIVEDGRRMAKIIDALLALARYRHEHPDVELLDMTQIVNGTIKRIKVIMDAADADFQTPVEWPPVVGYAPWIKEVWTNYLSNALKYGGTPAQIQLGADTISRRKVQFWVQDNGPGITPEDQSKLFIPFSRLDNGDIDGQGLGLSIVKRIITCLGGEVGVESKLNEGSRFWFTLPTSATIGL